MSPTAETSNLDELERRRGDAALRAAEGEPGGLTDLQAIEAEIFGLRLQLERDRLAHERRQARALALQEKRKTDERRRLEGRLASVRIKLPKAASRADEALDGLLEALDRLLAVGAEADGLTNKLGEDKAHVDRDRVARIIRRRLNRVLPQGFERGRVPWSRLAELFGSET